MPISYHVPQGTLLMCDFNTGFAPPEMTKHRLVVALSPAIKSRPGLCTVVALSMTPPHTVMPYHAQIDINPPLPKSFSSTGIWIKGDMVYALGFHRLDLVRLPTKINGQRQYYKYTLSKDQIKQLHRCVLHGMGLSSLTSYL